MKLCNPNTGKSYDITKHVYENSDRSVLCGIAEDPEFGNCFIKIMRYGGRDRLQRQEIQSNAAEEARIIRLVSQCTSKVPKLHDHWDDPENEYYVIVMEYLAGDTLRTWMKYRPAKNLTQKDLFVRSQIIFQLCVILKDINRVHPALIHRDLKPENIIIRLDKERHWEVFLLDFGCTGLKRTHNVGTAAYQAPEQIGGMGSRMRNTFKTDIFSLGQILYELLLGTVPVVDVDYQKRSSDPEWNVVPELTPELLGLHSGEHLNSLLKRMTRFQMESRPNYQDILTALKKVELRPGRYRK